MSAETKIFPYREISDEENTYLKLMIGMPNPERNRVNKIFEVGGSPLLRTNERMIRYMGFALSHTVEEFGDKSNAAQHLFSGGALFYAAVFHQVNRATKLPIYEAAFEVLEQQDIRNLIFDGPPALRSTTPAFCYLLDGILPTFEGNSEELARLAFIGASAVHRIVIESDKYNPVLPDSLHAIEVDPTFQDLRDAFGELDE